MEWISITERLPEQDGEYIIHTLGGSVFTSYWEFESFTCVHAGGAFSPMVTHWMPLPEPPKKEKR